MKGVAPIGCDIHPVVPGLAVLLPYLDDHQRETVVRYGIEDLTTIADRCGNAGRQGLNPFGTRQSTGRGKAGKPAGGKALESAATMC